MLNMTIALPPFALFPIFLKIFYQKLTIQIGSIIIKGMKAKKGIAIILLFVSFMAIFSSFFVYAEAHHECDGDDCPVCSILLVAKTVGKFVFVLFVLLAALWALSFFVRFTVRTFSFPAQHTPIYLKTKLSC